MESARADRSPTVERVEPAGLAASLRIHQEGVTLSKLIVGIIAFLMAGGALAGRTVPLGTSLGRNLGVTLGEVLGLPLGADLPIAGVALLMVAAGSLVTGIYIVRRKKNR